MTIPKTTTSYINKDQFIRLLAERMNETQVYTREFLDEFTNLLADCSRNRKVVRIPGLGKLEYHKIKPRKGYDPVGMKPVDYPEGVKTIFSLSNYIRKGVLLEDLTEGEEEDGNELEE
jgi:nucleoid DNA-binding protein